MFNAYEQAPFPNFLAYTDGWIQPFDTIQPFNAIQPCEPFDAMAVYWRRNPDATATTRGTPRKAIAARPRPPAAPAKKRGRGRPRKEPPPSDGKARIGAAKIETPLTRAPGKDYGYLVPAGHKGFRGRRMPWVRPAGTRRKARAEACCVRNGGSEDGNDGGRLVFPSGRVVA